MYLSDLLAKLESGAVEPKVTATHAGRTKGFTTSPGQQHLRDMDTFRPDKMTYQSMDQEWSGAPSATAPSGTLGQVPQQ
jgi:hypothetical protein